MTAAQELLHTFDMLDLVLAVIGATIGSLLLGRGRSLGGMLGGALIGGSVKPVILGLVLGGLLLGYEQSKIDQKSPEEQDKILDFWLK